MPSFALADDIGAHARGGHRLCRTRRTSYAPRVRRILLGIAFALGMLGVATSCSSFGTATNAPDAAAERALDELDAEDVRKGPFCSVAGRDHDHCWDFTDPDVQAGWTGPNVLEGGTFSRDTTEFTSPPASLRTEALPGPAQSAGRLVRHLAPQRPGTYSLSFSIWKECIVDEGMATFVELYCKDNTPLLRVEPNGRDRLRVVTATVVGSALQQTAALDAPAPDGRWVRIEIQATYGGPGPLLVTVDGVDHTASTSNMVCPSAVELLLGAQGIFDSGTCVARLDDVLLDEP